MINIKFIKIIKMKMKIMIDNQNLAGIVLSIACMTVMLRGPQILRQYLYKSGTGSGLVSLGSIVAMKTSINSFK